MEFYVPKSYFKSSLAWLVGPNWFQRLYKSLSFCSVLNICLCLKRRPEWLICAAWGLFLRPSPSKYTSNPFSEGTVGHTDSECVGEKHTFCECVCVCVCVCVCACVCVCVCPSRGVKKSFYFDTKWKAAYQMAHLGLTHGWGIRPRATRRWPPALTWSPLTVYRVAST